MKFSRYIGTTPTIIIPLFGRDCKDVAGAIFCRIVGKGRYLNYCKKHGITRNYLVKKEEYDGIDAMKFYDKSAVAKFEKNRKTQDRCR